MCRSRRTITTVANERGKNQELEFVNELVLDQRLIQITCAYLMMFFPGRRLSTATASATSPSTSVAFQFRFASVLDATNFGMALTRSKYGSP
jgi:hypothetical protein